MNNHRPTLRMLLVAFLLLAHALCATAASFMPIVHNYHKSDYMGALQNWDIAQGVNGEIYVGNTDGLLCFDGYNWTLTPLPGDGIVRSVMTDGRRVYVGSYKEFGYFERNARGQMVFTSLWPKDYDSHNDEIWNIVKDKRGHVYFQSFSSWFDYDGKRVTPHFDNELLPLYFFEVDGEIYAQIVYGDFYRLHEGKFEKLLEKEQFGGKHIVAALSGGNGRLILCSDWGIFDYDGSQLKPRRNDMATQLKASAINRATLLTADSTIVVGTIIGGIYGIGADGHLRWHYHMGNRLSNNTVLGLIADRDGDIWAALDMGLAHISTGSRFSLLAPDHTGPSIGMVYAVLPHGNDLYVASNQAAWLYSATTGSTVRITGSEGQNWHLSDFDGQLILGNNESAKWLQGTAATSISGTRQSSTNMCRCRINGRDVIVESTYYVLRIYEQVAGRWQYSHDVDGFHAPVAQFEVDPAGNVWAAHMSRGLYMLRFSPDLRSVTVKAFDKLGTDTVGHPVHVMKIRGRTVFSSNGHLYTFDDLHDQIVPYNDLDGLTHGDVLSATEVDGNTFWLADADGFSLIVHDDGHYRMVNHVSTAFFGLDVNDTRTQVFVRDNVAYFSLNNGVGRLDMAQRNAKLPSLSHLQVVRATSTDSHGHDCLLPVNTTATRPATAGGAVDFVFTYPNFTYAPLVFTFHLTGPGLNLTDQRGEPSIDYGSLGYGAYHLHATVSSVDGMEIDTLDYYFVRPRPLYASWWAWLIYAAVLSAAVYALVGYRTRRTAESMKKQYEDRKLQQDLKVMEQEKIIAEQKQLLLEAQLHDKTQEVASMALDAVARNRAIDSIRDTLREKRRKGVISPADMATMMSQLGENADSDNFWELYQKNFNLVHKNFFKRLKEQYPSLTASDLRFCALLRLNLPTKDIARFTALSVRGVEGARYRLRKKFNLSEGQNLIDFLINFE